MSKSAGQVVGGIIGATIGFISGGPMGAIQGYYIGSGIGGMIDPPPGPDLKGPTLEDASFNSAAYGVPIATLYGTIAQTGQIIYLENNEYKAIAKKQKTGGKGGAPTGSYTTTTYYATFAVAFGEAMPGSAIRRVWAGGKLIYSVGDGVDVGTIIQSEKNAGKQPTFSIVVDDPAASVEKWHYYDGSQTEPDSRMEATLGVDNCPSYEGTAYIIFYDFDLTEYGNGLQGCPIKVEIISNASDAEDVPAEQIFSDWIPFPAYIDSRENHAYTRSLTPMGALYMAHWTPYGGGNATAGRYVFDMVTGWDFSNSEIYDTDIHRHPGLTFGYALNWHQFDSSAGLSPPPAETEGWNIAGWQNQDGAKISFGDKLYGMSLDWDDEVVCGATYFNGDYYVITYLHILKLSSSGSVLVSRDVDDNPGVSYISVWFDSGFLYRAQASGGGLKVWVYDGNTLDTLRIFSFGSMPYLEEFQFAVYGSLIVVGWSSRHDAVNGELHYEQWRFKDFGVALAVRLDTIVGHLMDKAGVPEEFRNLIDLSTDFVAGYRITDASTARGSLGALQVAYLFDLIDSGYQLKAIKRGATATVTIPLTDLNARAAGDAPSVLVRRDRETDSQLPSRYSLTYIDYNREYDTGTQYADYPSRAVHERNQQLPIVLSADEAAKLADVLINLSWVERDSYVFTVPQKYLALRPSDVISVEVAAGIFSTLRISNINYTADQRLEISAKRAAPAVYQSGAVGIAVAPPSELISLVSTASTLMMDLPSVNDTTAGYGFGAVMYAGNNWKGGALLRSVDAGQTYDAIQSFSASGTVAVAQSVLPVDECFVIDRTSTLNISVKSGDFFSITESQMLTGKNYCAYGADGRWEILQYANAVINSETSTTLSIFLRGLFGTEWATGLHHAGDFIVLLDDPDNAFIGADAVALNSPRKFKGVTTGQDAQDITALDFIYRGVNLKPLSAVLVSGTLDSDVWSISWQYRSRLSSSQWSTGSPAALGEDSLLFDIEVYDGINFKKSYRVSDNSFIYSADAQIADFGFLPTTITVKIYQISGAVGRGFPAEKILIGDGAQYSEYIVLLLHFNGANNSVVFLDTSLTPKTITAYGNAKISTAKSLHGGSSLVLDGAGDYLVASSSDLAFAANDFTVEFWVNLTSIGALSALFDLRPYNTNGLYPALFISSTSLQFFVNNAFAIDAAVSNATDTWMHIAVVRYSGVTKIYKNGTAVGTSYTDSNSYIGSDMYIGASGNNPSLFNLNAYFEEYRVFNGVARYTANFTPSAQQFPDPI